MSDIPDTIDSLLEDLNLPDPRRRNAAARRLRDLAESAVDALLRAAARPENRNHRGTLIHALSAFNWEGRFSELFDLALHGNDEVQCHALSILQGQAFSVTDRQVREAERALADLREREDLSAESAGRLRDELQSVLSRLAPPPGEPD